MQNDSPVSTPSPGPPSSYDNAALTLVIAAIGIVTFLATLGKIIDFFF